MTVKRIIMAATALGLALGLSSCGGASESGFSGYVADHWPHWAGGMPDDVPPRPGAPGYDAFIAHGQASQDAIKPAAGGANAAAPVTPVFQATPPTRAASAAQAAPAVPDTQAAPDPQTVPDAQAAPDAQPVPDAQVAPQPGADDPSVVKGGLY
jgi:hypothetical protein